MSKVNFVKEIYRYVRWPFEWQLRFWIWYGLKKGYFGYHLSTTEKFYREYIDRLDDKYSKCRK